MGVKLKGWRRWVALPLGGLAAVVLALFSLDMLFPPPLQKIEVSAVITDRNGEWLHAFTIDENGQRRWRLKAALEDIDPIYLERLIAIEDKRFWDHHGVDLTAVVRATGSMIRTGKIVSGASTITMQTARLLEPRPRTVPSKLIEMARAIQLERRLTKQQILELYLTYAPYGGNLEGVRSASIAYFGKEPSALTDAEQALLIALPQAPEARRPDRNPAMAEKSRAVIINKLAGRGLIAPDLALEAKAASVPANRHAFPRQAIQTAYQLRSKTGGEVRTSLDKPLQTFAEQLAARFSQQSGDKANLAILIIDNNTMEVRAHVGSAGLDVPGGWIDMMGAERSPGSTLKPLIYGIAFDDGAASTKTLIDDAPYTFGTYRPENFTHSFHGDVTVKEALQHSLNVPAVLALDQIGPNRFVALMEATGVHLAVPNRADEKASLAIALGGVGFTGKNLGMLYTSLANGGVVQPLKWHPKSDKGQAYQFLTGQTADRITQIMRLAPAPKGRSPSSLSVTAPKVAFKTGTSYGYRDAWSAGYSDQHTVIVWAGHANGTPRPGVTGREAALPILFEIFDRLQFVEPAPSQLADGQGDFEIGGSLRRLAPSKSSLAPEIVFPEDGVHLLLTKRVREDGFVLSARGGTGAYNWYVDGQPIQKSPDQGRPIWYPAEAGFYKITVVDGRGVSARSQIVVQ